MISFLKELYLSEFTSFYRASKSSWSHHYNAGKGVAGVSLFTFLIFAGIETQIEILVGKQSLSLYLAHWYGWIATFVVFAINYYILVIRGHGIRFEREFDNLKKSKQKKLRASCWVMEIASAVFVFYSIYAYRHYFHIIPKY